MWIIVRLVVAVLVGLAKFLFRRTGSIEARETAGIAWVLRQQTNKKRVVRTWHGIPFPHPVYFRLSHETGLDRFCKHIGFSTELQTGEESFDRKVYVACDHPALKTVLQEDSGLRHRLAMILGSATERVFSDGEHLWVQRKTELEPDADALRALVKVRDALDAAIPAQRFALLRDPFFWRALFVESIAWSIAFYGVPAFLESAVRSHPLYFQWLPVIGRGLLVAVGAFALLVAMSWIVLRGSSRAHRVFVESALVLALGVPFSCIEVVSDVNIGFDRSAPARVEPVIESTYKRVTHSRRQRQTQYHIVVGRAEGPVAIPRDIQVSASLYGAASRGSRLVIVTRSGALGFPWVESMHVSAARKP